MIDISDFDYIKIGLASTREIHSWSSGEVTKPETINYRTLKPEREGLFCERIFGPTKDWECYCGKYKRVRYKGIICERCGVEVTRQKVRRERMGHIDLAAPVSHIWFFKGVPSRIGYLLDIAPKDLEKVLYFAAHICTFVDHEKRAADLTELDRRIVEERETLTAERGEELAEVEARLQRRRQFLISGSNDGFDDDDEYWARTLGAWAEENGSSLEEARELSGGMLKDLAARVGGEDPKRVRELVHGLSVRDDRRMTSRELDSIARVVGALIASLETVLDFIENGRGTQKGAARKTLERMYVYLGGVDSEITPGDRAIIAAASVDLGTNELDKTRAMGNGLLVDTVREAVGRYGKTDVDLRQIASDLCLKQEGPMSTEARDQMQNWALKVREMVIEINQRRKDTDELYDERLETLDMAWETFKGINAKEVIGDERIARELKDRFGSEWGFGQYLGLGMGAEAIRDLLDREKLDDLTAHLRDQIATSKGQKQQRAIKRLKVVSAFHKSENHPSWMILDTIPVLPPELRPMVQLDGGRFATSDLNDLYRRVINRNNRLKRLLDLGAPEIIVNNEKRMLQEAVDALFDNGRRGRAVTGPGNRPLKSLSDMLKGKQGRFRQNLLGKRVDYSGRSVIVAGPQLLLHQCGLPKLMALELFKPFIMSRVVERKEVQNIKAAKKLVDSMVPAVWDVLEEVIDEHPVLLNRAPTLHRLGIQAFEPVLVDGKAIQVHPLVCTAFNADFDGDQMAVHLPLSVEAQAEARVLMLSSNNILSPANGRPLATPSQDMVIGLYYMTYCMTDLESLTEEEIAKLPRFSSPADLELAFDHEQVKTQQPIVLRVRDELQVTTPGRVIFNYEVRSALANVLECDIDELTEDDFKDVTKPLTKRETTDLITWLVDQHGASQVARILDTIKALGFRFATRSGVTISKNDIVTPSEKEAILAGYEKRVERVEGQFAMGYITRGERHEKVVGLWNKATDEVGQAMQATLWRHNPVYMMANSGARGSFKQIRQLAGMRGLMANPKGEIIERPIRANFMEGLSVLEYFISTHGARKGLADTALRTADSGYLTRRLVDVSQDVIVRERDCGTDMFIEVPAFVLDRRPFFDFRGGVIVARGSAFEPPANDQLAGRVLAGDVDTSDGVLPAGTPISRQLAREISMARRDAVSAMLSELRDSALLADPVALAERLGLDDAVRFARMEIAGEDPFLTVEAVDDLRTPEKFARRMADDGYPGSTTDLTPDARRALLLKTLAWALNDAIQKACMVPVRSVMTCEARHGVCGACYGLSLATGDRSDVGDAVGIIAAQSIGEPGTQLTMRTFHTGGVAGADITHGLPRVVELFEARTPKMAAAATHVAGRVVYKTKATGDFLMILPLRDEIEVREVEDEGPVVFYRGERMTRQLHEWLTRGVHNVHTSIAPTAQEGQIVLPGQEVLSGIHAPGDLMAAGLPRATRYLVDQVQQVYRDQGVEINDKHIEVIVRQMTRRVLIDHPGSTEWLPGQYVEVAHFLRTRDRIAERRAAGEEVELPTGDQQMLGITKASLATESFLSAASFQETTKVLTDAAIEGKIDRLLGLKENVIIGKLIPASTGLREYRRIEIEPAADANGLLGSEDDFTSIAEELSIGDDLGSIDSYEFDADPLD